MAGARRGYGLVLARVACFDGELFFPVFPVAVGDLDCDGRADGLAVADAARGVDLVGLDLHAAAAAVALLSAPELAIDEVDVDGDTGGQAGDERDESFAVRFSGGFETNHDLMIIRDSTLGDFPMCNTRTPEMQSRRACSQSRAAGSQSAAEILPSTGTMAEFYLRLLPSVKLNLNR